MTISPISSTTATGTTQRTPTTNLGKDDFLKLLAGQLRHQDPMSQKGGEEFMAQMTQFAMLEQLQNVAAQQEQQSAAGTMTQAVGLIGKQVTFRAPDGAVTRAVVERVITAGGVPQLVLAGREDRLGLGDVAEIA